MDQPDTSSTASKKRGRRHGGTETPVPGAPATSPAAVQPRRSGRFAAGLALVFAAIALIASGYMGYLINSKRGLSDAKGRLFQVEQETAQLVELSAQMNAELGTLRESNTALGESLKSLQGEIGKGRRTWLLSETENLLVMAGHRLAYARDARLALEALRAADRQLVQLGDPDYLPVRKLLEKEMAALADYQRLDPDGMARRLGELAAGVGTLPFAPQQLTPAQTTRPDEDFARELWHDLKSLVRIRSTTDIRRPFLLPEQAYYVRENLRLMLYGAQVALLHGDAGTFERNLTNATRWLRDYFDAGDKPVAEMLAAIEAMLKTRPVNLPALGAALEALRDRQAGT